MLKKIFAFILMNIISCSVALADIIDPGWPPQPRPIPAPPPEPVDDGEVVVIKLLIVAMVLFIVASLYIVKRQKAIKNT